MTATINHEFIKVILWLHLPSLSLKAFVIDRYVKILKTIYKYIKGLRTRKYWVSTIWNVKFLIVSFHTGTLSLFRVKIKGRGFLVLVSKSWGTIFFLLSNESVFHNLLSHFNMLQWMLLSPRKSGSLLSLHHLTIAACYKLSSYEWKWSARENLCVTEL